MCRVCGPDRKTRHPVTGGSMPLCAFELGAPRTTRSVLTPGKGPRGGLTQPLPSPVPASVPATQPARTPFSRGHRLEPCTLLRTLLSHLLFSRAPGPLQVMALIFLIPLGAQDMGLIYSRITVFAHCILPLLDSETSTTQPLKGRHMTS